MNEIEKLRVLIPHWIEHNKEHANEFRVWAARTGESSIEILAAADAMGRVNDFLVSALAKLGGALPHPYFQGESDDSQTS